MICPCGEERRIRDYSIDLVDPRQEIVRKEYLGCQGCGNAYQMNDGLPLPSKLDRNLLDALTTKGKGTFNCSDLEASSIDDIVGFLNPDDHVFTVLGSWANPRNDAKKRYVSFRYRSGIEDAVKIGESIMSAFSKEKSMAGIEIAHEIESITDENGNTAYLKGWTKYLVEGTEIVYDGFDDHEHDNYLGCIAVQAPDLASAIKRGESIFSEMVSKNRKGFTSGTFIPHIERVRSADGKVLHEDVIVWS